MEALLQDIRFALRMIARHPWLSAVVVLVMAIGIGATTAMFSVADALLLRPLPYSASERVVFANLSGGSFSPRDFHAIRKGASCFETLAIRRMVFVTVVTLVASYLPARRATRISPMLALHAD